MHFLQILIRLIGQPVGLFVDSSLVAASGSCRYLPLFIAQEAINLIYIWLAIVTNPLISLLLLT
jgi:hypothetical protein